MKIEFSYGHEVLVLPRRALTERLGEVTREDLAVLIALAADPDACADFEAHADALAGTLQMERPAIDAALAFWRGAGVIRISTTKGKSAARTKADRTAAQQPSRGESDADPISAKEKSGANGYLQNSAAPQYTSEQIVRFLDENAETRELIDTCQQILGKMFNPAEVGVVVAMRDYLRLEPDYILVLVAYCADIGKKSLRYIEKTALSLHDEGIDTADALEAYVKKQEAVRSTEGQLRRLFGLGERALTAKEKKCVRQWVGEWSLDFALIARAYEITIGKIGKPSIPYTNGILERWHESGYKTPEDVDAAAQEYQTKKEADSSFDTDEFLELALKRTYG